MALAYKDDIPWGAALRFHVEAQPGGTNRVVQCIQNEVGKIIGSRVTFMRLYFSGGPEMLEEKDQQRAWFLTAAIGKPASDWGIVDAVLPGAWFRDRKGIAKRIREAVVTMREARALMNRARVAVHRPHAVGR